MGIVIVHFDPCRLRFQRRYRCRWDLWIS